MELSNILWVIALMGAIFIITSYFTKGTFILPIIYAIATGILILGVTLYAYKTGKTNV